MRADYKPDLVGLQELEGQTSRVEGLLPGFKAVGREEHGVNIMYREATWKPLAQGTVALKEQDKWGQRIMKWARFEHKASGELRLSSRAASLAWPPACCTETLMETNRLAFQTVAS